MLPAIAHLHRSTWHRSLPSLLILLSFLHLLDLTSAAAAVSWGIPTSGTVTQTYSAGHTGVDIAGSSTTRIVSAQRGKVTKAGDAYDKNYCTEKDGVKYYGGYGNLIIVDHGTIDGVGVNTYYAHWRTKHVNKDDNVCLGTHLADQSDYGAATGVHLHFELRENGSAVDPAKYYGNGLPANATVVGASESCTTIAEQTKVFTNPFPFRWYFLIGTIDDRIREIYLDGQLLTNNPVCTEGRKVGKLRKELIERTAACAWGDDRKEPLFLGDGIEPHDMSDLMGNDLLQHVLLTAEVVDLLGCARLRWSHERTVDAAAEFTHA